MAQLSPRTIYKTSHCTRQHSIKTFAEFFFFFAEGNRHRLTLEILPCYSALSCAFFRPAWSISLLKACHFLPVLSFAWLPTVTKCLLPPFPFYSYFFIFIFLFFRLVVSNLNYFQFQIHKYASEFSNFDFNNFV